MDILTLDNDISNTIPCTRKGCTSKMNAVIHDEKEGIIIYSCNNSPRCNYTARVCAESGKYIPYETN